MLFYEIRLFFVWIFNVASIYKHHLRWYNEEKAMSHTW